MSAPGEHYCDEHFDAYVHELLDGADARRLEAHCNSCPACQAGLAAARKRLAAIQSVPPTEASEALVRKIVGRVEDHEIRRLRRRRIFGWTTFLTSAAAILILGFLNWYYYSLAPSPYNVAIFGQSQMFPGTPAAMYIRLTNQQTGAVLRNVPVEIELRDRKGKVAKLAAINTNDQGIAQPRFRLPEWPDGEYQLSIIARPDGSTEKVPQTIRLVRTWKVMLSSDKPVYQPGQEIHLRSLALRKPDLKPVKDENALFTISDPKGNMIFKRETKTSSFGIASADCLLATEVIEGPYRIVCKVGDTESTLTVEVKKYVLPKFKIEVEGLEPYYQPGATVKGTVKVDYFFGNPVAGGEVELEVRTALNLQPAKQPRRPGQPPVHPAGDPNLLQRITARTGADGKAAFDFKLPEVLFGREPDSGDARFFLNVKVKDSAGQEEKRTVTRTVTNQPMRIEVIPEAGQLAQGIRNRIYLFVSYADGRPAAKAKLTVLFERGVQQEVETNELGVATVEFTPAGGSTLLNITADDGKRFTSRRQLELYTGQVAQDFVVRTDKSVYNGGDTMKLTAFGGGPGTVFVDLIKDGQTFISESIAMKDGQGKLAIDLPPDLFGTIDLSAYRIGQDGLAVRKSRIIYVRTAQQLTIQTKLDRDEYRPAGQVKLQFQLTDDKGKPAPGALSLAAVDEAVFSVLEQAPGMERTFYLLEQELLEPIYAIYPWSPDRFPGGFNPGQIPDVIEFEQALFARTAQSTVAQVYPRIDPVGLPGSLIAPFPMPDIAPEPMPILGASNRPSPHSLATMSYPKNAEEVRQRRETGLEWVAIGWVSLVAALFLTCYIAVWCFVRPLYVVVLHVAAVVPFVCMVSFLVLVQLSGADASSAFGTVGASIGSTLMMGRDASAEFAPKSELPAEPAAIAEGSAPVRIREYFPETLYWKPELITDDQGRASLELPLADSITTWRLTASAVSGDGKLGGSVTPIKVFQPFFVDLNLPVALTRNDEVSIPVVVYNYLNQPQTVTLTMEEAGWFERTGDPVQTIELKPKEVRSTSYRMKVTKVGNHHLQVNAQGLNVADAVKRSIEVVPDGQKVEQVVNERLTGNAAHTITIPDHAIPDSQKIIVKLYPGVFSQVIEGIDGMLRMPFG